MNRSGNSSSRWPFVAVIAIVGVFVAYVTHVKNASRSPEPAATVSSPSPTSPKTTGTPGASPELAGPGTFFPSQGHEHWDESKLKTFRYNSNPPTSGPHEEVFADGYISRTPLSNPIQVHLLEHGSVILSYNCVCPDLVKKLTALAQSFDTYNPQMAMEMGKAVLIAPNPTLDHKIVLTAWTRRLALDRYDEGAIKQFITAWLGNARNSRQ